MLAGLAAAPAGNAAAPGGGAPRGTGGLSADIRYTEYGIPHILARDYAGLGFGTGYAAARDNVCLIADGVVTTDGERSKYFGPDAAPDGTLSSANTNLSSDLFFAGLNGSGLLERLIPRPYPFGPHSEIRELNRGWVAGYNRFLREGKITDPACKGAPWLRPITELDLYRRAHALAMLGGHASFVEEIIAARPPGATGAGAAPSTGPASSTAAGPGARPARSPREAAQAVRRLMARRSNADMGSNAIAVGADATANGRGLLLGNPHYPWHNGRRFWQFHQTIPGRLDVAGAGLLGIATVQIGHTASLAWSHTVATGVPFSLAEVKLVPGAPTRYVVDGKEEAMTPRRVTVTARRADGGHQRITRTQWWTRYGPVITGLGGTRLPWTASSAYAVFDPNATNLRVLNTSLGLGTARTAGDAVRALRETQGLPWVNTIAADSRGRAVHAQIEVLPNVTDEFAERCNTPLGRQIFPASGLAVLDGSTSSCTPGQAPGALQPGVLAPDRYPVLERSDYVTNSNDSHWLSNPEQPQDGFDRIIGDERSARSLRTRSGLISVRDQLARGRFTRAAMQRLVLANRTHAGELAGDATVTMCREMNLGEPCEVLARWDRHSDVGSRGALLFDRYWRRASATAGAGLWTVPFDPADPVDTPRGLNTGSPAVRAALTDAVAELRASRIPLDAPLGENQYVVRNGRRIPIGGGVEQLGVLNMIVAEWVPGTGYPEIQHGSSYIQVVSFDGDGCPDARTLLTYSQSNNPASPHYADQTPLFSRKRWVNSRFCTRDVLASPALSMLRLRE